MMSIRPPADGDADDLMPLWNTDRELQVRMTVDAAHVHVLMSERGSGFGIGRI